MAKTETTATTAAAPVAKTMPAYYKLVAANVIKQEAGARYFVSNGSVYSVDYNNPEYIKMRNERAEKKTAKIEARIARIKAKAEKKLARSAAKLEQEQAKKNKKLLKIEAEVKALEAKRAKVIA